jgi:aspartate aminotransferase-like enzyme/uncharacterized protein (DUF1015 family)
MSRRRDVGAREREDSVAKVAPFRAVTYSRAALGEELGLVVAEPYDKIDDKLRAAYLDRHPQNCVRLILGRDEDAAPSDLAKLKAYPRARAFFDRWLQEGVLERTAKPALYVVETDFELDGKRLVRRGLIGRVALDGEDVRFHERTFAGPKSDRRVLMDATDSEFDQVFFLVEDEDSAVTRALEAAVQGREPDLVAAPDAGRRDRVWRIDAPEAIEKLEKVLARREVTIADGHHRFEMARERWRERKAAGVATEADRFRTAAIFATSDPGLVILPTHRLVRLPKTVRATDVPLILASIVDVEPLEGDAREVATARFVRGLRRGTVGLFGRTLESAYLLRPRADRDPLAVLEHTDPAIRGLEVTWLHALALDPLVGEARHDVGDVIGYQRGVAPAIERVASGEYDLAFFLPPTQVDQVVRCGRAGARMPQKSTDFYPKLLSGLVMDDKRAANDNHAHTEATRKHPRLWIPGPVEVDPSVLEVLATPLVGHRGPEFKELYDACQPGLRSIFGTERPVYVSTSSATGVMEGCVRNLVRKKSLHLCCGAFSERWYEIARECGREPVKIEVEWGKAFRAPMLEEALQKNPDTEVVFVTHSETSTGVLNPLFELAAVCRARPNLLLCVDAVSSLSTVPVDVDKNRIDVLLAGTQKGLGLPPGLAVFHVSERAMTVAKAMPGRGHYFDFAAFQKAHELGSTPCTPAVSLFYALRVQLERIAREGLEARYRRHQMLAARARAWAIERLGLFPEQGYASYGLTTVVNTKDFDWKKLDAEMRRRGHVLGDGYGKLKGKTFRIAHMGDLQMETLEELLEQLNDVLGV